MAPLAEGLLEADPGWTVIAICGDNPGLLERLGPLEARHPGRLRRLGFTDRVADLMAASDVLVTKPGPGSLSEAFHQRVPVVVIRNRHTIPQERFNTDYVARARPGTGGGSLARDPGGGGRALPTPPSGSGFASASPPCPPTGRSTRSWRPSTARSARGPPGMIPPDARIEGFVGRPPGATETRGPHGHRQDASTADSTPSSASSSPAATRGSTWRPSSRRASTSSGTTCGCSRACSTWSAGTASPWCGRWGGWAGPRPRPWTRSSRPWPR